ncbi:FAD-dependent monooxygenase [Yoonia sediminilitoris]|uniref:Salicylate hydroxylase n=1 Tax=Yoonia sediminilitoris TaxID=1286148 RepID=A0A2T6KRM0_9RHOB|nr:FAD-dependent monooxygenase [Yoonia sediminilitoris]PUB19202.1 salicylate hydroxylase [Yoonia sediminilitoris]RCW99370.1 salicylate hydroxylase [Yoonia sediminilitoris]
MRRKNATNAARRSIATTDHNAGRDIAIIGGGIGGLTAALAFARSDAHVTVYEQAPALTEVGAGLQITPNAARALNKLDLTGAMGVTGLQADAVLPMDGITGEQIARFDLGQQSPPYRFFHRAALIDLLARACDAQGVTVRLNCRIEQFHDDGFVVRGQDIRPDLIVGADGLRSEVRSQILPPRDPFFTGQVAWRAMVKLPDMAPVARIWMLPGRHVVTYPLPNGRVNIVAVQERDDWAAEGWHHKDAPDNLRAAFADAAPELQAILDAVDQVFLWGLFRHPVAARWHSGRFVLLGDAAHPTLPFLAQGANLAIEDAYVLARSCGEKADISDGLQTYQSARQPRVIRAINAANSNAKSYHLSGVKRKVAHTALRTMGRIAPDAFLGRMSWLYDHDVTG